MVSDQRVHYHLLQIDRIKIGLKKRERKSMRRKMAVLKSTAPTFFFQ